MDEGQKKKYTMILGAIVIAVGATVGILRAVGCERGAQITEQVGEVVDVLVPDNAAPEGDEPESVEVVEVADAEEASETETATLENEDCGSVTFALTLKVGDKGPEVRELQEWLQCSGERLAADGVYGSSTEEAVARQLGQTVAD